VAGALSIYRRARMVKTKFPLFVYFDEQLVRKSMVTRRGGKRKMAHQTDRRELLKRALSLSALVAGASPHAFTEAFAQDSRPLTVGVVASITGGAADINNSELNGLKLYLKQINHNAGGRAIKLIVEDDAGDPARGLARMRKLVELDKADILVGPFLAHVVAATKDYIGKSGVPNLVLSSQAPENASHPNIFVPSWNSVQLGGLMGEYAYTKLGFKTANVVSSNYGFGIRVSDGFKAAFKAAGGKVNADLYVPLGTADWLPFLSGLPKADTAFSAIPGADAIRYVHSRADLGLTQTMPLTAVIATVDGVLLPSMGKSADGAVAVTHYLETLDIPENVKFVRDYTAEYGAAPAGYYEALGYTIGQIIGETLNHTKGVSTAEQVLSAWRAINFKSPHGRFRFAPGKQFPILDFYFVQVVPEGNKRGFKILDVRREVLPD
jgi:branched-chain amino acid transport system substrate-binding protein